MKIGPSAGQPHYYNTASVVFNPNFLFTRHTPEPSKSGVYSSRAEVRSWV